MPIKHPEIKTEDVVAMYESGMTQQEINNHFGLSIGFARSRLLQAGVSIKPTPSGKRSKVPTSEIISLYNSGLSAAEVARRVGTARPNIHHRLKKAGIKLRPQSFYRVNKFSFKNLKRLTIKSAWVMGWLFSGSSISRDQLKMQFNEAQKETGLKIKEFFDFTGNLSIRKDTVNGKKYEYAVLRICSKELCQWLKEKDLVQPRATQKIPDFILQSGKESIIQSFLRGSFEACGSQNPCLKFCGNESLLLSMRDLFERHTKVGPAEVIPSKGAGFHRLIYCKNADKSAITDWLYPK